MQATNKSIPDALRHWELLPPSAHVRLPVVCGLYGCSAATVWRRVNDKTIPAPSRLSPGVTAWRVGDLRAALNGQQHAALDCHRTR